MKTFKIFLKFICLIICSSFIVSCSSNDEDILLTDDTSNIEEVAVANFINSFDELNAKYPSVKGWKDTWVTISSPGAISLADTGGAVAGASIGKWVGGVIGSIGGPGTTVLGVFIGNACGRYVCSFLASGITNLIFSAPSSGDLRSSDDDFLNVSIISSTDSIGYYHNCMMTILNENKDKYYTSTGEVDYELVYDDVVNYLKEIGKYETSLGTQFVKKALIKQMVPISSISEKYKSADNYDALIDEQCDFLKAKCLLSDEDIKMYREFYVGLCEKTLTLPETHMTDYAEDVNRLIENSDFSQEKKEDLSRTADLAINSAIIWKANY